MKEGGTYYEYKQCISKTYEFIKKNQIEQYLNEGKSISEISELINKSRNTVYYEIKKHRQLIKCIGMALRLNMT